MKKVLAYGFPLDSNFGGPSVAHGLYAAIQRLNPGCELVVYCQRPVPDVVKSDMEFPVKFFPYHYQAKRMIFDWVKCFLFGRVPSDTVKAEFWRDFRAADAVVNIYAICFCAKLAGKAFKRTFREAFRKAGHEFLPSLLARLSGKLSIKSTSSYGPITSFGERLTAWIICMFFFKRVIAREPGGRDELRRAHVAKPIPVAPDIGNMMPLPTGVVTERGLVGVSVSFMSERQWVNEAEDYVSCMAALIRHVLLDPSRRVVIVPNQINIPGGRDDIALASQVVQRVGDEARTSVFDLRNHGSLALKSEFARCEVIVSCRYHASVAALSLGVPTLVIGWHEKYVELMGCYRQDPWLVPNGEAASKTLCKRFDALWTARGEIRAGLSNVRKEVMSAVVESLDKAFG